MPLVRTAMMATAACLIGATAYAQTDTANPAAAPAPPPATADQGAATGAAAPASATVDANGNQVIASQPVPDTRENRKAFGQPLSRAGRRTAPKGN